MNVNTTELMRRKSNRLEEDMFPVSIGATHDERTGGMVPCTVDHLGRMIAKVSTRYELINNRDILAPVIDRYGIDALCHAYRNRAGFYTWKFKTGRQIEIAPGDMLDEQIILSNSYNKTRSFRFMLGAFRMVCSNGMYTGHADAITRRIHVGTIPAGQIILDALTATAGNNFDQWRKLASVPVIPLERNACVTDLSVLEEENTYKDVPAWEVPQGCAMRVNAKVRECALRLLESNTNTIDNPPSAWGVYNQVNRAITRVLYSKSDQHTRAITANRRAEQHIYNTFCLN